MFVCSSRLRLLASFSLISHPQKTKTVQATPSPTARRSWRQRLHFVSSAQLSVIVSVVALAASLIFFVLAYVLTRRSNYLTIRNNDLARTATQFSLYNDCHDREEYRSSRLCQPYLSLAVNAVAANIDPDHDLTLLPTTSIDRND